MGLQLTIRQLDDVTILDLEGRATIGKENDELVAALQRLTKGGTRKLLVNVTQLSQIDSSGISTLVRTFVALGKSGGSLKLVGPAGRVRQALAVARLLGPIPAFDDEAAALASFKQVRAGQP
ncbi:MAG TPA: STAS domain-containing protein [Candidatus Acidoferrales bacterium]|nr:STAS domain-containing protein [Candidatus Acidoferrales bacterium]